MKQTFITEQSAQVVLAEGEIAKEQPYQVDFASPDEATHAMVMVEALSGSAKLSVTTQSVGSEELEELSKYNKVRLRFIRLAENTKTLAVKVTTETKALVRVTVAFVKREAALTRKKFSCRLCKQLCRLGVSALFAHFGVPFLDVEHTVDLPGVPPPDMTTGGGFLPGGIPLKMIESLDGTVPVQIGEPVSINDACKSFLEKPESGPGWIKEFFESIDPKSLAGMRLALEMFEWVFDATDRIYTAICEFVGMCAPEHAQGS